MVNSKKRTKNPKKKASDNRTPKENQFLKKVGLKITYDLNNKFEDSRLVEWLSWETGIARSALREIMAGRSNPNVLTIHRRMKI